MAKIGHLVNGAFVAVAQDFDILDAPEASETSGGMMSAADKIRLDDSYTSKDIATPTTIQSLFNKKGE